MIDKQYIITTKELWAKHIAGQYLIYPNENVVRYCFSRRKKYASILDFGCGDGRHTELFAKSNWKKVIAVDYNENCVEITKKRCLEQGYDIEAFCNQNKDLSSILNGKKVDCILAWGALFYNSKENVIKLLSDIATVINNDGEIYANFRTHNDSLYQQGEYVSENTYKLSKNTHNGFLYYFPTIDDIKEIYEKSGLTITAIDKEEFTMDNKSTTCSWNIITAKKEGQNA